MKNEVRAGTQLLFARGAFAQHLGGILFYHNSSFTLHP